jgi:HTH-type transcriptional regulator/antitoxin HigA
MSTIQIQKAMKAWPQVRPAVYIPANEREYRKLVRLLDQLIDVVGEDENHSLASMMEIIGVLIEKYEDEHVPELA